MPTVEALRKPSKKRTKRKPYETDEFFRLSAEDRHLVSAVLDDILYGKKRELYDALSPKDAEFFRWFVAEKLSPDARSVVQDFLWDVDYDEKPVSIQKFIEDDDYLGGVVGRLHENWKRDLATVFAPGSRIFEWIFGGAIGTGKTTVACVAFAYLIYKISCLKEPARHFGLLSSAETIAFTVYANTIAQAERVGFSKLRGYIDNCPYFQKKFVRDNKNSVLDWTRTGKRLKVHEGSRDVHALGEDLLGVIVDEANFMDEKKTGVAGDVGQARSLYNQARQRIESRFLSVDREIPGLLMLVSSEKSTTSFTKERLENFDQDTMYLSHYARWDIHDEFQKSKKFRVEVGDRARKSRILGPKEKEREDARIIEVPVDFRRSFEEDVEQALRDIAGVATYGVSSLIKDRQSVFDCVRKNLVNPFPDGKIELSLDDDRSLEDYLDLKSICRVRESRHVPRFNPRSPRFIHADLSYNGDCLGLAMGHIGSYSRVEIPKGDGTYAYEQYPVIWIDMMVRVWPPQNSEIDLSKVHRFINYIRRIFPVERVTCDGFQSIHLLQLLRKQGVDTDVVSMDRNHDPYLELRALHFHRHIVMPHYEPYLQEVIDLEHDIDKKRVDHPDTASVGGPGRKDVADAVCGVAYNCLSAPRQAEPVVGSGTYAAPSEATTVEGQDSDSFRYWVHSSRKGARKAK